MIYSQVIRCSPWVTFIEFVMILKNSVFENFMNFDVFEEKNVYLGQLIGYNKGYNVFENGCCQNQQETVFGLVGFYR